MLNLSKSRLKELLSSAYESGWSGCLELKSEYVEQVMAQFDLSEERECSSTLTVAASPTYSLSSTGHFGLTDSSATFIPGYYSSFGQTSAIETLWVNNSGQDAF